MNDFADILPSLWKPGTPHRALCAAVRSQLLLVLSSCCSCTCWAAARAWGTGMAPGGGILATSPTAQSPTAPVQPPCGCYRHAELPARLKHLLHSQAAAQRPGRLRHGGSRALHSSTALGGMALHRGVRWRGQLHLVAAGGPAGGINKSRVPRGREVTLSLPQRSAVAAAGVLGWLDVEISCCDFDQHS